MSDPSSSRKRTEVRRESPNRGSAPIISSSVSLSDTTASKVLRRVLSANSDELLEDGPVQLPKPLVSCTLETFVLLVRKKASEEDCEELIVTETVREEGSEKVDRDFGNR